MSIQGQDETIGASSTPAPDGNTEATTSDASTTPNPAPSSGDTDASAQSSSARDPKEALLAVVESVIAKSDPAKGDDAAKATPAPDSETDPSKKVATGETQDAKPDVTDIPAAEMAKYSPNAQRRIKELIDANKALRREMEQTAPVVEGQRQMVEFMEANNLNNEHVQTLFTFGAALRRGDFAAAKELVEPYYFAIKEALGEKLHDDLVGQVQDGIIDENAARELTKLRAENARLAGTVKEVGEAQQTAVQHQSRNMMLEAVANWEKTVKARDPDYAMKQELIQDAARAVLMEKGLPAARNPQEAVALAQEAYSRVNARVGKFRPSPQPTRPVPTGGSSVATPVVAKPKSLMDAVEIGIAQSRNGL